MATWWNDFKNSALSGVSVAPAVHTVTPTPADADYVDMKEAEIGLFLLAMADTLTGTWTITLEESDDGVGSGDVIAGISVPMTADGVFVENFKRSKRFVRAILTETVAGTATIGVSLHGMLKRVL